MALRRITITLSQPVEWFGKRLATVTLKEPTAANLLDFGLPQNWGRTRDGIEFVTDNAAAQRTYLDHCLEVENGCAILSVLSFQDGLKIKEALLSFFRQPEAISKDA
ncbi:MAG TPA: hypothetical protein VME69_12175 [Methylocella sp.]|nr:hypothetical protein [Methylocella sp.]